MHDQRPTKRSPKRSQGVVLTTLAAAGAAASLQGCGRGEAMVDAQPFSNLAECQSSGRVPANECQTAYSQALANHEQAAPRFESQPLCEEEFGAGRCQQRMAGSGNFWMPMLAGFMVGRMQDRQNHYYYRYGPLYHSYRSGGWYTGGDYGGPLQRSGNGWRVGSTAFDRPTSSPSVRTRASVSSRGGFGGRSSGGWGG